MNIDNLLIEEDDIKLAQEQCKNIKDSSIRSNAVANTLGPILATKLLSANNIDSDIESSLHKSSKIIENFNISDIYINGSYIDVRICFDENDITIPQKHFENNILPVAYMFIKVSEEIDNVKILGFLYPEDVDKTNLNKGFYYVSYDSLISYYDIESSLAIIDDPYTLNEKDIFAFIDNNQNNVNICKDLIKSKSAREIFLKILNAKNIFNFISKTIDIENLPQEEIINPIESNEFDSSLDELKLVDNTTIEDMQAEEIQNETIEEFQDIVEENTAGFDFNTSTTPNLEDIEKDIIESEEEQNNDELLDLLNLNENEKSNFENDSSQENIENSDYINTLYTNDMKSEENVGSIPMYKSKKHLNKKSKLPLILVPIVIILVIAGYFGYTKFSQKDISSNALPQNNSEIEIPTEKNIEENNAMPIETVEDVKIESNNNEPISTSIPAIEQNLDASILVENLKVDWEVPAGYTSNVSIKRYLVKLGKVIQLNLKTELLLLNKPPITNQIRVEIQYDSNMKKFKTVQVLTSSGEQEVDNLILKTLNKVLDMHVSVNNDSFASLKGNPVLVIKL